MDVQALATAAGVAPSTIIFLLALLSSIPLGLGSSLVKSAVLKHVYLAATGIGLCLFAYGGFQANLFLYAPIIVSYIIMRATRRYCGYIVFSVAFIYLVYCHAANLSGAAWRKGGVDFTGTLMVLTLKLVSCAMDYQDGALPADSQQAKHRMYASRINVVPSLLEFLGFVFFSPAVLVGPIFDFKSYREYCNQENVWSIKSGPKQMPTPLIPAIAAFVRAVGCIVVYQFLLQRFTAQFFMEDAFFSFSFLGRLGYACGTAFTFRWMYFVVWSVAESAVILSGFGFRGWTSTDPPRPDWSRAKNVDIWRVEVTSTAAQLPAFWNIAVGNWLRTYVYDRITPASNKPTFWTLLITQIVSAFWHGLYPGYYLFFVSSALAQHASKAIYRWSTTAGNDNVLAKIFISVGQFFFKHILVDYAMVGFIALRADVTWRVWRSLYFLGAFLPLAVLLIIPSPAKPRKIEKEA